MNTISAKFQLLDSATAAPIFYSSIKAFIGHSLTPENIKANSQGIVEISQISSPGYVKIEASAPGYPEKTFHITVGVMHAIVITKLYLDLARNVFFSIYYKVEDDAFKRASETWESDLNGNHSQFKLGRDVIFTREVTSEHEFKAAWQALYLESKKPGRAVVEGRIFSHSSINSKEDGLEFKKTDDFDDGTLKKVEIESLNKLNWSEHSNLVLHGCNTGVTGSHAFKAARGWAPAESFARTQSVRTEGQMGFAYFSANPSLYVKTNASNDRVFLWAFRHGKNLGADGGRMPPAVFTPTHSNGVNKVVGFDKWVIPPVMR